MSIDLRCNNPACNRKLVLKDELLGKTVKCPHCSTHLVVADGKPGANPASVTEPTREFLIGEHKLLRDEIMELIKEMQRVQALALIASGGIWSWLATNAWHNSYILVLYVPAMLSFLCWLRWRAIRNALMRIAGYLQRVETALDLEGYGWETHVKRIRETAKPTYSTVYHWSLWALLIIGNLCFAGLFWWLH